MQRKVTRLAEYLRMITNMMASTMVLLPSIKKQYVFPQILVSNVSSINKDYLLRFVFEKLCQVPNEKNMIHDAVAISPLSFSFDSINFPFKLFTSFGKNDNIFSVRGPPLSDRLRVVELVEKDDVTFYGKRIWNTVFELWVSETTYVRGKERIVCQKCSCNAIRPLSLVNSWNRQERSW